MCPIAALPDLIDSIKEYKQKKFWTSKLPEFQQFGESFVRHKKLDHSRLIIKMGGNLSDNLSLHYCRRPPALDELCE